MDNKRIAELLLQASVITLSDDEVRPLLNYIMSLAVEAPLPLFTFPKTPVVVSYYNFRTRPSTEPVTLWLSNATVLKIGQTDVSQAKQMTIGWALYIICRLSAAPSSKATIMAQLDRSASRVTARSVWAAAVERIVMRIQDALVAENDLTRRLDWWFSFCSQLEARRLPCGESTYRLFTPFFDPAGEAALHIYLGKGLHKGALANTPHEKYEQILALTPQGASSVYLMLIKLLLPADGITYQYAAYSPGIDRMSDDGHIPHVDFDCTVEIAAFDEEYEL